MKTRSGIADLSRAVEDQLVLSVYLARENEDPGKGPEWRKRLDVALGALRSDIEARAPADLSAFENAADRVLSASASFGRILPHEGWCAFATEDRLWLAEALSFRPPEAARWRLGACVAPYVRALKVGRPAILAVLMSLHADLYRYQDGELSEERELRGDSPPAEAGDIGMSKRASTASGVRGVTRADYVKRAQDENVRRHRKNLTDALVDMAGEDGVVVLGGTPKAISAARKDLEAALPGRIEEVPELAFDASREELVTHVRAAASRLTEERQKAFLERCADPRHGTGGWNETYRALAAAAVDKMLVARALVESSADDAERLVRLALAQGAEVEEVGGELGDWLMKERGGVAARLRFVPASLKA